MLRSALFMIQRSPSSMTHPTRQVSNPLRLSTKPLTRKPFCKHLSAVSAASAACQDAAPCSAAPLSCR